MDLQALTLFYMEIIGTIAFSVSGAMVGIKLGMDLFGVMVLGCCTACGGGLLRDVILGRLPAFLANHLYIGIAALAAVVTFVVVYANRHHFAGLHGRARRVYDLSMLITDAIGLAAFTVVGISVSMGLGHGENTLLLVFMGCLTAAGGGLLRDTMAGVKPYIFTKHIYALASIFGGLVFVWLHRAGHPFAAMAVSSGLILLIRVLAAHYRWNLPKIPAP